MSIYYTYFFLEEAKMKVFNPPRHESGRSACSHRKKCWRKSGMWYMLKKITMMDLCCDVCNKACWYKYDDCNMLIMFIVLTARGKFIQLFIQTSLSQWISIWKQTEFLFGANVAIEKIPKGKLADIPKWWDICVKILRTDRTLSAVPLVTLVSWT